MSLIWSVPVRQGALGLALALLATGLLFAGWALLLEFGTLGLPGPGLFPFVLGILLAACALAIAAGILKQPATDEIIELGHRDVLIGFAALIGVCITFEWLGAYLALGLLSTAL